jgi:hypothetical protein
VVSGSREMPRPLQPKHKYGKRNASPVGHAADNRHGAVESTFLILICPGRGTHRRYTVATFSAETTCWHAGQDAEAQAVIAPAQEFAGIIYHRITTQRQYDATIIQKQEESRRRQK